MPEIFLPPVASHTTGGFFMLRSWRILADGKAVPKLSSQMEEVLHSVEDHPSSQMEEVLHSVEDHPRRNRREKQPRQAGDDGDTAPLKRQVPSSPPGARELKTGICRPYSNSRVSLSAVHCRCMAPPPCGEKNSGDARRLTYSPMPKTRFTALSFPYPYKASGSR